MPAHPLLRSPSLALTLTTVLLVTGLLATSLLAAGCADRSPSDAPLLDDADAVLDSLVTRWTRSTEGITGYTVTTEVLIARYARQADGTFALANVEPRAPEAAGTPVQFLQPDPVRIAELLRGQASLYVNRAATPPSYRLVADSTLLAEAATRDPSLGPYAAPVAADAVVEAGAYRLREVHTRSPLPGSTIDSALVDLRITYDDYHTVEGLPVPHTVRVVASGLLDTFDDGELLFMRSQVQLREQRLPLLPEAERAAEEAELAELRTLLTDGVSTEQMSVESVTVDRE